MIIRNVNYDFSVLGLLEKMVADDPNLHDRVEAAFRMYIRGWYGDIPDNVKAENQLALTRWKGIVYGHYRFGFDWDDVIVMGRLNSDDTVDVIAMFASDLETDIPPIN